MEQKNIKLNNVIREIQGKTVVAIISSILDGERDPHILAQYKNSRIRESKEKLVKSLVGNWREEQLFNLKQAYKHCFSLQGQLTEYDKECEKLVNDMSDGDNPKKEIKSGSKKKNNPDFNVSRHLNNALGVDVTQIYGVKSITALNVFSETGPGLNEKFPTEKQFLSWLNVMPDTKVTGIKVIKSRVKRKKNKTLLELRDAANSLWKVNNSIGEYLRSKKALSGGRQAIVATARKIASIYYKMVTEGVEFDPQILNFKTQEYLNKRLRYLEKS